MKDSIERDRELLENLDNLIVGKDSEIAEPLDDDTRTTLDIARKVASLGEKPTKEFSKNLKARLVHQLAEEEKKELARNQGFLFRLIPQKTKWQGTIAAIILVIIIAIILLIVLLINRPG
jgi:hypothetical protein